MKNNRIINSIIYAAALLSFILMLSSLVAYYEFYYKWNEKFNDEGRYFDPIESVVYTNDSDVLIIPVILFASSTVVLMFGIRRRKIKSDSIGDKMKNDDEDPKYSVVVCEKEITVFIDEVVFKKILTHEIEEIWIYQDDLFAYDEIYLKIITKSGSNIDMNFAWIGMNACQPFLDNEFNINISEILETTLSAPISSRRIGIWKKNP